MNSTEFIHPDGSVSPGPSLPDARYGHCQVSYEDTTFIIGKFSVLPKCFGQDYIGMYSNPSILAIFWAKQNIAKIEVIYDQYLKIANLRGITM